MHSDCKMRGNGNLFHLANALASVVSEAGAFARAWIARRPDWTISVALVEAGRPVVAALYAPVSEELFLAVAGAGATRNGTPIKATPGAAIEGARIAGPKGFLDRLATVAPAFAVLPKIQSLALRLARVADGTLDAALASRTS